MEGNANGILFIYYSDEKQRNCGTSFARSSLVPLRASSLLARETDWHRKHIGGLYSCVMQEK